MTKNISTENGFLLVIGKKAAFMRTDATRKTKKVVFAMIDGVGKYRGFCPEMIERIKSDKYTFERIQREMEPVTVTHKITDNVGPWLSICGRNFGGGYDYNEMIIF